MAAKPMTLELVPMDPPSADDDGGGDAKPAARVPAPPALAAAPAAGPAAAPAAAPPAAAAPAIEFVKPGASPIDLDATQPIHADRYLREATLQYQEGHVDAPLWDRALAQANGDKEAASAIYVKSRAIALRMLERERRARQPGAGPAPAPARPPDFPSELPDTGDADVGRHPPATPLFVRYRIPLIAAGVLVLLLAVGWLVVDHFLARPAEPAAPVAAASLAKAAAAKAPAAAAKAAPAGASAATTPARAGPSPDLIRKIDELREAKNWNLLVLYLVEWTRQDPRNVDAWNQLRAGYLTLRQYDDALAAAKKAAELAPDDAGMRARVGDVQVYRDDPAAALTAFEEAVARDTSDVDSRIRIGLLHAQLGRAPEAKAALDGALAVAPGDPLAQCVRLGVGQMTTSPGDTYGRAREARAIDAKCRGQ